MAKLTPDATRTEHGLVINEKIIPWGAVWPKDSGAYKKGAQYKADRLLSGGTGKVKGVTIHNTNDLKNVEEDAEQYCKQKGVPFYKMELPSIIVSYANEGARTKIDELKKVKFSKRSNKAAQGDKSLTVDVDMMIVGGVYQDGVAPVYQDGVFRARVMLRG